MKTNVIYLSHWEASPTVVIPKEIVPILQNYQIHAIRFLYDAYNKKRKGAILNEDPGMNLQLQVTAFLAALFHVRKGEKVALIVSRADNIMKWHYHLSNHGRFNVTVLTQQYATGRFEENKVVLVSLDDINYVKTCPMHEFFCVVVDDLDKVANKMVLKKLKGDFNIGITGKNFLMERNQKIQYNMLKWVNPDKYGKLLDFYEEDKAHFENFRDAYSDDWLRLTWSFSDNFKRRTEEEEEVYKECISQWIKDNNFSRAKNVVSKTRNKRKAVDAVGRGCNAKQSKKSANFNNERAEEFKMESESQTPPAEEMMNIGDILDQAPEDQTIKLPHMDESPILTSIIRNLRSSSKLKNAGEDDFMMSASFCGRNNEESILYSLVEPDRSKISEEEKKKQALLAELFGDDFRETSNY